VCTSAEGHTVAPMDLLKQVHNQARALTERFSRWRATGNHDSSDRESLRKMCPADSASPDTDIAVAKDLLADPALYRELIQTGTTNLARR